MINFPSNSLDPSDNPQSASGPPAAAENPQSPGRPRALDGPKRADILELLSAGFDLTHAARQVRCSVRTIRREMKRDQDFARAVRRSEIFSLQNPLGALQHALHRNWRAATWLLERLFPERFGRRPQTTAFGKRQARQLLNEVLRIVDAEVIDTPQRDCINGRIRATFEYFTHVYCEPKRSKAALRQAIKIFEKKDNARDLEWLASVKASSSPMGDPGIANAPSPEDASAPKRPATRSARPQTFSEAFQDLIDDLKAYKKASRFKSAQSETKTNDVLSPTISNGVFAEDKMDKTSPPQQTKSTEFHDRVQVNPDILT
jgi:hypothetical protein